MGAMLGPINEAGAHPESQFLNPRSAKLVAYSMCGFANFASIGDPTRRDHTVGARAQDRPDPTGPARDARRRDRFELYRCGGGDVHRLRWAVFMEVL